jgi:hypothetical protein
MGGKYKQNNSTGFFLRGKRSMGVNINKITQQASFLEASDQWEVNINKITQQASFLLRGKRSMRGKYKQNNSTGFLPP